MYNYVHATHLLIKKLVVDIAQELREEMQLLWRSSGVPFLFLGKNCKTSLITTKLNWFDIKPNIKIAKYISMRLPFTFLYKLISP